MTPTRSPRDAEPIDALVESVTALAEHARQHGPAPGCSARLSALIEKHRARIAAARQAEGEAGRGANAAE